MGTDRSSSPRRARIGLPAIPLLVVLAAWQFAGLAAPGTVPTPLRFLRAAFSAAASTPGTMGTAGTATAPEAGAVAVANAADTPGARLAFRPLPYVIYGLKPS